jgi:hypothetical protein
MYLVSCIVDLLLVVVEPYSCFIVLLRSCNLLVIVIYFVSPCLAFLLLSFLQFHLFLLYRRLLSVVVEGIRQLLLQMLPSLKLSLCKKRPFVLSSRLRSVLCLPLLFIRSAVLFRTCPDCVPFCLVFRFTFPSLVLALARTLLFYSLFSSISFFEPLYTLLCSCMQL